MTTHGQGPDYQCLEKLVGNVPDFLSQHWNRRACVFRDGEGFTDILALEDVDDVLAYRSLRPPYLRLTSAGRPLPASRFTNPSNVQGAVVDDVADLRGISREFAGGATIIIDALEDHVPSVDAFRRDLARELNAWVETVGFVTPANQPGLSTHMDNTEVFVLQVSGTKRWIVFPQRRPLPEKGSALNGSALGPPELEVTLYAGDCLYIPWGAPHSAVSESQLSCHLSIMVRQLTLHEVVADALRSLMSDDMYHPIPIEAEDAAQALQRSLSDRFRNHGQSKQIHALIEDLLRGLRLEPSLAQRHGFLSEITEARNLTPGSVVTVQGAMPFDHEIHPDGRVILTVGPRKYRLPAESAAVLHALQHQGTGSIDELSAGLSVQTTTLLVEHLISCGAAKLLSPGSV